MAKRWSDEDDDEIMMKTLRCDEVMIWSERWSEVDEIMMMKKLWKNDDETRMRKMRQDEAIMYVLRLRVNLDNTSGEQASWIQYDIGVKIYNKRHPPALTHVHHLHVHEDTRTRTQRHIHGHEDTHTRTRRHTYTNTNTQIHTDMHTKRNISAHEDTHTCTWIHIHALEDKHKHTQIKTYIH